MVIKEKIKELVSLATDKLVLDFEIEKPQKNFGDYSVNAAFIMGNEFGSNPAERAANLAGKINERLSVEFEKVEAAGGYVNFFLSRSYLQNEINKIIELGNAYGSGTQGSGHGPVIVEYFQNNVAKPPHVGHLRSAVIGDSILRTYRFLGYRAISDTHIGDWGTQFGILIHAYKQFVKNGGQKSTVENDPISELNKLYVAMSARIEEEPELKELGKAEFKKLEDGDPESRELWQWFVDESMKDFERYRILLELTPFDKNLGESFYEDKMPAVFDDLKSKGLITESEGAQIVNLEDTGLGVAILKKSDGATTYLLRDLATLVYRKKEFNFYKNLYVVDVRQSHHFEQLFEISKRAGYESGDAASEHIRFGFMSLPEGAISTRKGNAVSLKDLVTEARRRAMDIIMEKNPILKGKEQVATRVALAALKYFDLSHNRRSEIVFSWDKALNFEGNTGPYLQYTHARIHGILRKSIDDPIKAESAPAEINKHETEVMRKLCGFSETVEAVLNDHAPHLLCNYLFELSQTFNAFYETNPVLRETNSDQRGFRLNLIRATAQVLKNGLFLLGIEAPAEI